MRDDASAQAPSAGIWGGPILVGISVVPAMGAFVILQLVIFSEGGIVGRTLWIIGVLVLVSISLLVVGLVRIVRSVRA